MARISLNSNISSLTTQRRLGDATRELSSTFERLSSGLRINRASDDAAGLAIADNLNADSRVFAQGIRNLNDGLSLLNVADGALTELSNIVVRIRELAEQSANGTLSNKQREALDQEAQELSDEFTRIAQTTEYNGLKLFDGSLGELSLQAGYGVRGAVTSTLGGTIGDGTFDAPTSFSNSAPLYSTTLADFNSDGILDMAGAGYNSGDVYVFEGLGDGTFGSPSTYAFSGLVRGVQAADINEDGNLDLLSTTSSGEIGIQFGNGSGSFGEVQTYSAGLNTFDVGVGDINGDGKIDLVAANGGLTVFLGLGEGVFSEALSLGSSLNPQAVSVADINQDGLDDIISSDGVIEIIYGDGSGSFQTRVSINQGGGSYSTVGDVNGDGWLDLIGSGIAVTLADGQGGFSATTSFAVTGNDSVLTADLNGDGNLDLLAADRFSRTVTSMLGDGNGSFGSARTYVVSSSVINLSFGDLDQDGVGDLIASGLDSSFDRLLGNTTSGVGSLLPFSLSTKADALQAMAPLDRKIEQLALQKGTIGAFQSRVEVAINNLQISSTNVKAAESRIRDVDVAFESARLTRLNILQQAGAAVLGQANIQPALALQLLDR